LRVNIKFSQHHLLKRMSFSYFVFLTALSKLSGLWRICKFILGLSILFHCLSASFYASTAVFDYYCFEIRNCDDTTFFFPSRFFGYSGFL
jgi:hypothetical protein